MYRKTTEGWLKHADFILLDMLCLQIAFVLAYLIRNHGGNPYYNPLYRNMTIFLEMADWIVIVFCGTMKNILRRSKDRDFVITLRHTCIVGASAIIYLFVIKEGGSYSRMAFFLMMFIYMALTYVCRILYKNFLLKKMDGKMDRSLLIITTSEIADEVIQNIKWNNYARYWISGVVLMDKDLVGTEIQGIPVVANHKTVFTHVCQAWIDEVLIVPAEKNSYSEELFEQLSESGVTIHLQLAYVKNEPGRKQFVEKVGPYMVLTNSINSVSASHLAMKRCIDIVGGLVGCFLTGIIFIAIAPIIYTASPGPIFFKQERVGRNGRRFKMYKFRSMYMDAEARRAELMKENKMDDDKMFKLDFDPRVIGNRILPDGTHKTGIGEFIRRTSLDEFPQFFNVLKGDMSIVGTRPPLVSETDLYELHHWARLAIKPGITGMWQVSGRSNITDFEEVVRLDKEYIQNWSIRLDIRILLKTVKVVLLGKGAV